MKPVNEMTAPELLEAHFAQDFWLPPSPLNARTRERLEELSTDALIELIIDGDKSEPEFSIASAIVQERAGDRGIMEHIVEAIRRPRRN